MTDEIRNCIICGKEYKPYKICQKTCGSKKCMQELDKKRRDERNLREKINRALRKEKKKHNKGNNEQVIDIANTASKEGLSYGKYQEQADIERMRREGFWKRKYS